MYVKLLRVYLLLLIRFVALRQKIKCRLRQIRYRQLDEMEMKGNESIQLFYTELSRNENSSEPLLSLV